jgi:hypothetical protein
MANDNNLPTGLATVLAPSVGATLFLLIAILALHRKHWTILKKPEISLTFDSLGSPCEHYLRICWATCHHQGDVLHHRVCCGDRLGHGWRDFVCI